MTHTVKQARDIAHKWLKDESGRIPGFSGAFLCGSITTLADGEVLPPSSDVDVMVILDGDQQPAKLGKFIYEGVLLEVSFLSSEDLQSPEQVLGNYQLAGSFASPMITDDPTGLLTRLQQFISENFAKREWVGKRCEDARAKALRDLAVGELKRSLPEEIMGWIFGVGKVAHILLVAALKNPTVRKRYVAVREVLQDYGQLDVYEPLLQVAGLSNLTQEQADHHLHTMTEVFDATCPLVKSSLSFASDISPAARTIAIDGTRTLIEQGYHREAMFWVVVTYSRCLMILQQDASPQIVEQFMTGFQRLLADLGVHSVEDIAQYKKQARDLLPRIWQVSEAIIAANSLIK